MYHKIGYNNNLLIFSVSGKSLCTRKQYIHTYNLSMYSPRHPKRYCVHRAFIKLRQRAVSRLRNRAGLHSPVS